MMMNGMRGQTRQCGDGFTMNFLFQTLSEILKAFVLIIKRNSEANQYLRTSDAHFWLSWLMVIAGCLIYLIYLPSAFATQAGQNIFPKDVIYSNFKSANMISLIFVLLAGYVIVYLLARPLEYSGSIRRYIICQNWVFLFSLILLLPLSTLLSSDDNPLVSLLIFVFMFILYFAYQTIKITLGISGLKTFMLLLVLLVFELVMDRAIDDWYGLILEIPG